MKKLKHLLGIRRGIHRPILVLSLVTCTTVLVSLNAEAGILDFLFPPGNYFQCILDRMPGTASDAEATAISAKCSTQFPLGSMIPQQSGIFSRFNSGSECYLKKAKDTASALAQQTIQYSCFSLYGNGANSQ